LWIQVTGTWCNLKCTHCLNASGPKDPWLKSLDAPRIKAYIEEAAALGVKEIYFTGGEPFLHKDILELVAAALRVAPTTVLTNGTMITEKTADALAALAAGSPYSLEIRVSVDDIDAERNDRIRGKGALAKAVRALTLPHAKGLLPILTATEILQAESHDDGGMYRRFREFVLALGITKPRVKIIPVFPAGRMAHEGAPLLSEEMLQGFDYSLLQCTETRVVADGGVYACPILAGLKEARLSEGSLEESFRPCQLYHPSCTTCYQTGMTCKNA
jgi:MoaA/NifB/PqqE/SkfB family radical SAM enzyme